jgi:hypothetical protein
MAVASDYAAAVAYLDRTRLPAYVSFVEQASARGLAGDREAPQRLYVRVSDGAIVSGVPPAGAHMISSRNGDPNNPFGKRPFFRPQCYLPTTENQTRWNGEAALRFALRPICKDDNGISELYVDPQTLRPIAVDGTFTDTDDPHMTVAIELRYATIGRYTVPSSIRAHAVGHGWLFWARERAEVDYGDYRFYRRAVRIQASKP